MATNNPTTPKKADLPPKGDRNPDPITNEAGAHPIETGVGAALGGAGAGFAAGMIGGPVGAVIGTVAGAVVGGLAGKGIGESIDPTMEDRWLGEYYQSLPGVTRKRSQEDYREAYHYGLSSRLKNDATYDESEHDLQEGWNSRQGSTMLEWEEVQPVVRHAYSRDLSKLRNSQKSKR